MYCKEVIFADNLAGIGWKEEDNRKIAVHGAVTVLPDDPVPGMTAPDTPDRASDPVEEMGGNPLDINRTAAMEDGGTTDL